MIRKHRMIYIIDELKDWYNKGPVTDIKGKVLDPSKLCINASKGMTLEEQIDNWKYKIVEDFTVHALQYATFKEVETLLLGMSPKDQAYFQSELLGDDYE